MTGQQSRQVFRQPKNANTQPSLAIRVRDWCQSQRDNTPIKHFKDGSVPGSLTGPWVHETDQCCRGRNEELSYRCFIGNLRSLGSSSKGSKVSQSCWCHKHTHICTHARTAVVKTTQNTWRESTSNRLRSFSKSLMRPAFSFWRLSAAFYLALIYNV